MRNVLSSQAARKTWGVKGDMAGLKDYRRQQLQRWEQAQHVFDDEMLDRAVSQLLHRASSQFEGLFFRPNCAEARHVSRGARVGESPSRAAGVRARTHGWIDI